MPTICIAGLNIAGPRLIVKWFCLLEPMDITVDVLFEVRHAPAPVDQKQPCHCKSASSSTRRWAVVSAAVVLAPKHLLSFESVKL